MDSATPQRQSVLLTKTPILIVLVVIVALAIHIGLVLRVYPPRVLLAGEPPHIGDVSRHFATAHASAHVRGLYGYDPYFMAGYPVGLWNSMGKKGFEMLQRLIPWLPLPALFYGILVGISIASPLILWIGLLRFVRDNRDRGIFLAVILVFWHLHSMIAYFWGFGNVFFPGMACLLPVAVGCTWDMAELRRPFLMALVFSLLVTMMFYGHPVVLVAALPAILLVAVTHWRAFCQPRLWGSIALSAVIIGVGCLPWLLPLLRSTVDCVANPEPWFQSNWRHLAMDLFSDRVYLRPYDRNSLLHLAWIAGAGGIVLTWRVNRFVAVLGLSGFATFILVYGASYIPRMSSIQPYRFMIPSVVFLLLPAAIAISHGLRECSRADKRIKTVIIMVLLVNLPAFSAYLVDLTRPPLSCGVPPEHKPVFAWIRDNRPEGRLLVDDMVLGHLIPYFCDTPVIGGLSFQAFLRQRFAGIDGHGRLLGRVPDEWKVDANLDEYFRLYAITVAVLSRPDWTTFAHEHPELFRPITRIGNFEVFHIVEGDPSLVYSGQARSTATYDRIDVSEVQSREVILKLHYFDWLYANNGVVLSPVLLRDDPAPFIRCVVPSGVSSFQIGRSRS